eukprot:CAMPEP_0170350938 /NCGR_PEP_ID=MMETSP0116_2-20130129/76767_1 /TAXON_ID=400756 /ORGANISM="Durinskia baltica, Strain CSIRO CS-38" /LENGTH=142 /DNA_ID=CAMNT_0010604837 /DNA_START=300 /DNA_END=729 /DNA_ORIENTATION=-
MIAVECRKMKAKAQQDKLQKAMCLLNFELKEGEKISLLLADGNLVVRAVRVPSNDKFGLTKAFMEITPAAEIESELFSCHTYLNAYGQTDNDPYLEAENALRNETYRNTAYKEDYELLRKAMADPQGTVQPYEAQKYPASIG